MRTTASSIALLLALAACSDTKPPEDQPYKTGQQTGRDPTPDLPKARCDLLIAEMRALRDGPQPCAKADDCWVFHNGEHWDGCPVEVNKANNAILERLRAEIDGLGCPVDKGASCAAQEVKFCVAGGCGGKAP